MKYGPKYGPARPSPAPLGQKWVLTVLFRPVTDLIGRLQPAVEAEVLVGTEEGLAFRHRLVSRIWRRSADGRSTARGGQRTR